MDYLKKFKTQELKEMKEDLTTQQTSMQNKLSQDESLSKEDKKRLQSKITQCENAVTLVADYIQYRDKMVNLTSKKDQKSYKPSCGKSVKKSAEKYINENKSAMTVDKTKAIRDKDYALENPLFGEDFYDFETEITQGRFMNENIDNPSPAEWDALLEEKKTEFKNDENVNTHDTMPDNVADFVTKYAELRYSLSMEDENKAVYGINPHFGINDEARNKIGVKDTNISIDGLLRVVHFNKDGIPISDQDSLNNMANIKLMTGLSKEGRNPDYVYLMAYQDKVKELLKFEMNPEKMNFEFLIKNPEYFFQMHQLEKALEGYKHIDNFEGKFSKSYAFIQKYISNQNENKDLVVQLIDNKREMLKQYIKIADAIMKEKGVFISSGKIRYDSEAFDRNEKIDTEIEAYLASRSQKRYNVISERIQSADHLTEKVRKKIGVYDNKMMKETNSFYENEWELDKIRKAYSVINRERSVISNTRYEKLIEEIKDNLPYAIDKEEVIMILLHSQLKPYQNIDGDPLTEEDEEIYQENIRKLNVFAHGIHDPENPESNKTAVECLRLAGIAFYEEMSKLPEVTEDYVNRLFKDTGERLLFMQKFSNKISSFDDYYILSDQGAYIADAWRRYRQGVRFNGISCVKIRDKMSIYSELHHMVYMLLQADGYIVDNVKPGEWYVPNQDEETKRNCTYQGSLFKRNALSQIEDFNNKYNGGVNGTPDGIQ